MPKKHLILIGFMGSGKTTVGERLASSLSLPWVDTDKCLEQKLGCSIADYFKTRGEQAFRDRETALLKTLLDKEPSLITTGGGMVLREENRKLMLTMGWVVYLHAEPEVIIQRLQGDETRPLLKGNLSERIYTLYQQRKGMYDFADLRIDTSKQKVEDIVQCIQEAWFKFKGKRSS